MCCQNATIDVADITETTFRQGKCRTSYSSVKLSVDQQYFPFLLKKHQGNVTHAAKEAQITKTHFHRKIQTLGLDADTYRTGNTDESSY